MKNIPNIPFDDLGKVGKKVFYCVHKNLKLPTEELNQWQKKKKKKRKRKQQQQIKKQKEEKEKKVKDYFQTDIFKLAYGGRGTVNQAAYHAPKLIKKVSKELNTIATKRIDQFISQGGKEVERILPKITGGAIEGLYQTP